MSLFLVLSVIMCIGLGLWGMIRRFPWFVIKGAMFNGPGFLASAYALYYGVYYGVSRSGSWWLLALLGVAFGYICGLNLYHYVSGEDAQTFNIMVANRIRNGTTENDTNED